MIVCDKILEINPNQTRACFIKGAILLNLDHNEEGATYLFKLIDFNNINNSWNGWYRLVLLQFIVC